MDALRVVLDTNVVVSALLFREGRLAPVRHAWAAGRIVPLVSADTADELVRVLSYPKFRLDAASAKALLAHYLAGAETLAHPRATHLPACDDPDDVMFLRLAYAAKANMLVTGDRALQAVAARSRVEIVGPETLLTRIGRGA